MSSHSPSERPDAPPVFPGMIAEPPPTWPKAIGIISIIYASLGILMNLCGAVWQSVMKSVMSGAGPAAQAQMAGIDAMQRYTIPMLILMACNIALGVLLIVAGIKTMRHQRAGSMMHLGWAGFRLAFLAVHSVLMVIVQKAQFAAMGAAGGPNAAQMQSVSGMMGGIAMFTGCVMFISYGAYPVFILIWFSLAKTKAVVRTWA